MNCRGFIFEFTDVSYILANDKRDFQVPMKFLTGLVWACLFNKKKIRLWADKQRKEGTVGNAINGRGGRRHLHLRFKRTGPAEVANKLTWWKKKPTDSRKIQAPGQNIPFCASVRIPKELSNLTFQQSTSKCPRDKTWKSLRAQTSCYRVFC